MGITVQCSYCGRKNEVSENLGGSWRRCTGCKNRMYFPSIDGGERLRLKPVDKREQARKKALMEEEFKLRQVILREHNIHDDWANVTDIFSGQF